MASRRSSHHSAPANLADTVVDAIRRQLIEGALRPGQHLSESMLSEQLQVSRNTLREAFRSLIKDGLLLREPNRGVSVVVPSMVDIIDIYRVRRLIECQALTKAWPLHPAHQRMRQAVEDATAAREAANWRQVGSADIAFHEGIVALSDSVRLSTMFASVAAELRLAFGLVDDPEYLHAPFVDYNARLLRLFTDGQMAAAAHEMEAYLVQSERIVLSAYARKMQ